MARIPPCSVCGKPAVAYVRPLRKFLCREHFIEYFNRRVARILERARVGPGDRILVALSGGKDSAALLNALADLRRSFGYELIAVHIDLGIRGFSEESRRAVEAESARLGVPLLVVDLREAIGVSIPELARMSRRPTCSVCGLVKRYVLNAAAVESRARYIAMGHNGDDIIAYAIKSFLGQDLESLRKLGPYSDSMEGLAVGRLRPLYMITEKESLVYALLKRAHINRATCPHLDPNQLEVVIKHLMNEFETRRPGVKIQLLGNLARRYRDYPEPREAVAACPSCGLISSGGECSFCRLTRKALGEPMGRRVRLYIRGKLEELGLGGASG
ncbi:MAG: adenine nucleotide alpha hydrolase family protein [Desulfurococcales archaeon]|nr:adenine nucleotide alpha hydrolase family protein [Desulfurococcales archaeon]